MLLCAAGVLDVAKEAVKLLGHFLVGSIAHRQRVQCWRLLLDVASDIGDILPGLVKHQARSRAAWVALALMLNNLVPLLRV